MRVPVYFGYYDIRVQLYSSQHPVCVQISKGEKIWIAVKKAVDQALSKSSVRHAILAVSGKVSLYFNVQCKPKMVFKSFQEFKDFLEEEIKKEEAQL